MDIQFILDPYACAVYIVSYISKGQRGMSNLLRHACEEARTSNSDIRQQVRRIENNFFIACRSWCSGSCIYCASDALAPLFKGHNFCKHFTTRGACCINKTKTCLRRVTRR